MIGWGGQVGDALPPARQPEVCETFQYADF